MNSFLASKVKEALFIPYAGITPGFDNYSEMVSEKIENIGLKIHSLHKVDKKPEAINRAKCIIVGGGNTFHLLKTLQDYKLLDIIRNKVLEGIPYIAWSAGSNLACPTIRTTNDMPVVEPDNFNALRLIPFQINPHFTDFVDSSHAGETREMRIEEFLLVNRNVYVAGLREGTVFSIENDNIKLLGAKSCRIFRYNQKPQELTAGDNLNFLMQ
jgi:dipeptidase E